MSSSPCLPHPPAPQSCFSINLKWGKIDVHLIAPHNATILSVKQQLRIITQVPCSLCLIPFRPNLCDCRSEPSA